MYTNYGATLSSSFWHLNFDWPHIYVYIYIYRAVITLTKNKQFARVNTVYSHNQLSLSKKGKGI